MPSLLTNPPKHLNAPSKDEILEQVGFFFGEPADPQKLRDYSEHHALTYHFPGKLYPHAYNGHNTKIRDTLNNLILSKPQNWQTEVALPFVQIEGTTVEWDEIRFDVRLMERVPYEGVSRMQTSIKRQHRDRVVRRGIGLTIEHDFYATEAGRAHFTNQLHSIRYCVQETCNHDALYSYLTCDNYDFRYDLSRGLRSKRNIRMAMNEEINMFAVVQRDDMGLDRAVERMKYRMTRYQVEPNMLIVPPQLMLYMATAPEGKIRFFEGGERAVTRFEEGVKGYEQRDFRGLGVFTAMPYEAQEDREALQMLERNIQVGEFYRMHPPLAWEKTKSLPPNYMDILVYDEEKDQHVLITFEQAIKATGLGSEGCKLTDVLDNAHVDFLLGGFTELENAYKQKIDSVSGAEKPPLQAKKLKIETTRTHLEAVKDDDDSDEKTKMFLNSLTELAQNGVWIPVVITIARPFIEHTMLSAIATVAGRDTGATLFGPADMQISANTSVKTIEGHYTCHTKCVITKPQNVFVMRDIYCNGYIAGGNTLFFGGGDKTTLTEPVTGNQVMNDIDARLRHDGDNSAGQLKSMFAFFSTMKEIESGARDQIISLSNRSLPWEAHETGRNAGPGSGSVNSADVFPGGSKARHHFLQHWGLADIHAGEDTNAVRNMGFVSSAPVNNAICILGPHRRFNPWALNFYELVPGQGHFGPDALPGVRLGQLSCPFCFTHVSCLASSHAFCPPCQCAVVYDTGAGRTLAPG